MAEKQIQLTEEQREVVYAPDARLTVIAAAGSGKTGVLTARYVRLIEDGYSPDQILTITFTRKAAAEMKERIVAQLRDRGRFAEAQIAETGPIQTIHSFCERLLRENSLEAGLDPQFEILSDGESGRLITRCVREALANTDDAREAEGLLTFLAGRRRDYGANRSPYGVLEEAVQQVLRDVRGSSISYDQLQRWHENPTQLADRWQQAMLDCVSEKARKAFDERSGRTFPEALQAAHRSVGEKVPKWLRNRPDVAADEESLEHTCGLVQLALSAWWRMDREMVVRQTLDFTALETRAVALVRRSEATRERLRRQYPMVMVDEAQDLNPIQHDLLAAISPPNLMLVGDDQQSIYGFRHADPEQFRQQSNGTGARRLRRNFRSSPGILTFVDGLFASRWERYQPMQPAVPFDFDSSPQSDFSGVEIWRQPSDAFDLIASYIRELRAEGIEYRKMNILVRDSGGAQKLEKYLTDAEIPYRIMGGTERFFTRLEVRDLANALRSVADPYDDFALLSTLRSPIVGLTLDSVVLLAKSRPVVDRLATFEAPTGEDTERLTAFLGWFEPLRAYADRLSAWEVLSELFAHSDLLPSLARRANGPALLANVRKLLVLATKEPDLGPLEYAERIREIQEIRHKEGDAPTEDEDDDVITIQTTHKSKGLEKEVIILTQTEKRMESRPREVIIDPQLGLIATHFGRGQSTMYKLLAERRQARELAEEERVMYVALTRAKERLCICTFPPRRDVTVSKIIHEFVGSTPNPTLRIRGELVDPME